MTRPIRWPKGMYGCPIAMRQDSVCDADVEVVALYLQATAFVEVRSGIFHEQARSLLSTIFKDGET